MPLPCKQELTGIKEEKSVRGYNGSFSLAKRNRPQRGGKEEIWGKERKNTIREEKKAPPKKHFKNKGLEIRRGELKEKIVSEIYRLRQVVLRTSES